MTSGAGTEKTDRNDAHGIAQMMRVGLFKAVHVKTPASQRRRLLLTSRKLLQRKVQDLENDLRGSLRNFGLKVGAVGAAGFDRRVRELVAEEPFVTAVVGPLLFFPSSRMMWTALDLLMRPLGPGEIDPRFVKVDPERDRMG